MYILCIVQLFMVVNFIELSQSVKLSTSMDDYKLQLHPNIFTRIFVFV